MLKLLLIYIASYIGCRLIIRFLKEQKMIDIEDDLKIACIVIAPLIFIGLIVATLFAYICKWSTKNKREDEFVNRYNKKLPEVWYKLNRFLETGKPSILDNASTFDKEYDKYIDAQDLFNGFRPAYDTAKVVKTEAADNGPKDVLTGYHEAINLASQIARQTQQPIITATQSPAGSSQIIFRSAVGDTMARYHEIVDPIINSAQRQIGSPRYRLIPRRTDNIRKINDHINELFISIMKEKCRGR